MESDLFGFALDRREGTLGIGDAFLVSTGEITGRSPKDKYIVATPDVKDVIWWENNAEMSQDAFEKLYADMITHMSGQDYFVQDLYQAQTVRYPSIFVLLPSLLGIAFLSATYCAVPSVLT